MGKRILAIALVLLTLVALGCSKTSKSENADILKADENEAMTIDVEKLNCFTFDSATLFQRVEIFTKAYGYQMLPTTLEKSMYAETFATFGITILAYDINNMEGENTGSLLTYTTERGIVMVEVLCPDLEEYGEEFLTLCLSVMTLSEPEGTEEEDILKIFEETVTNNEYTSKAGTTYQLSKSEDDIISFLIYP